MTDTPTNEKNETPTKEKYVKAEKFIIPILTNLLQLENSTALQRKLGVKDSGYWSRIRSDVSPNDAVKLPEEYRRRAIKLCAELDPPVHFQLEDFEIKKKEDFLARIPKDHPQYAAARRGAGMQALAETNENEADGENTLPSLLVGSYARLLIARSGKTSTLTVENFEIRFAKNSEHLEIVQIDYEFENRKPRGTVGIVSRNDTIEIRIDYQSDFDPIGTFLAPFPSGHPVSHILALALDIHYNSRDMLAKPVLFVKLKKTFDKKDRFPPSAPIHRMVRQLFKKFVSYDASRMELSISQKPMDDRILEISAELEKMRSGATTS